jgi:hypothetical protein
VLVGGLQIALLLLIISFHYPALLPFGLPLVKLLWGESATHYPFLYLVLPTMFLRTSLALNVIVASIAGGAATLLFARAFGFGGEDKAWRRAFRCAPTLIVITLLMVGILFGIWGLASLIPRELTLQNSMVRWGTRGATLALFVFAQSLLVYATAWVVLMGHKLWPALRDSVRVGLRTFLPTVIAVGVPAVLLYPFSYAWTRVDFIASRFRPEMIPNLLGAEVVCQVVLTFILVGTITRMFVWRMEASR